MLSARQANKLGTPSRNRLSAKAYTLSANSNDKYRIFTFKMANGIQFATGTQEQLYADSAVLRDLALDVADQFR